MKHLLTLKDLSKEQIMEIINLGIKLKIDLKNGKFDYPLKNKTLGMIFSKSSTRTRVSFEVGMVQLGGYPVFLNSNDIQLGRGETIHDTAKVLSRYLDGITIRTYKQSDVEELAKYGTIPVINGLTDKYHPCQVISDLMTIYEKKRSFENLKLAYIGDGNNVAHSLLLGCSKLGINISVATPPGFECDIDVVESAQNTAKSEGSQIDISHSPRQALKEADIVYTDTWVSMGQEKDKQKRIKAFNGFQINKELFSLAKSDALFMHCLPAYRGFEMTKDIIDGPNSIVFDQAENRLHAQKAILVKLLGNQ